MAASFEYGTTENLGHETNTVAVSLTDTLPHLISLPLIGLPTDTLLYYYRLKVQVGEYTHYGDTRRLCTGIPEIPNWDFQNWQNTTVQLPSNWTEFGNNMQTVLVMPGTMLLSYLGKRL